MACSSLSSLVSERVEEVRTNCSWLKVLLLYEVIVVRWLTWSALTSQNPLMLSSTLCFYQNWGIWYFWRDVQMGKKPVCCCTWKLQCIKSVKHISQWSILCPLLFLININAVILEQFSKWCAITHLDTREKPCITKEEASEAEYHC